MKENFLKDQLENKAVIIAPQEGELYQMNGISINLKVTSEMSNDQLGVYEIVLAPKAIGAKLHYHRFMDETFIVNQGILHIQAGDEEYYAQAGTMVYVPRFTPHAFRNDSESEVKLTLLFNPAQKREGFFRGLHQILSETPINPEDYLTLYNKYDSFPVDTADMLPVRE